MKTLLVKLKVEESDKARLVKTLELNREACNICSKILFKLKKKNIVDLHKKAYKKIRKILDCPAQVVIRAEQACLSAYKSIWSNKHKIKEPAVFKRLFMQLDKRLYTFKNNGIKLTACDGFRQRIFAEFIMYPRLQEFLKYKACDPILFERDDQLWLAIPFETPEPVFFKGDCIGVDMGIRRAAVTSEGLVISRKDFNRRLRLLAHQKSELQRKNTKSARRKLKLLRRKHARMSKDFNHNVANKILDTKATTIVLENLKGIKNKNRGTFLNRKLGQWAVGALVDILEYKALSLGKRVIMVTPAFTSQNDWRDIPAGERKGCRYMASDGVVWDADWNAAMNIAKRSKIPISHCKMLDGQATVTRPNGRKLNVLCLHSTNL